MKKIIIGILSCYCAFNFAGIKHITYHSRANCINNESITWHLGHSYNANTESLHRLYGKSGLMKSHTRVTGWEDTWRSASVCWNEGNDRSIKLGQYWRVWGTHYLKNDKGSIFVAAKTQADDCSIYDGWWDY